LKKQVRSAGQPVTTDAELLTAVAAGELAPLGELYDRYAYEVWRAVQRTMDRRADVEDVVHATFVGLPRIAASYDGRANCRNWLCGIAVNLAMRHRRGANRFQRMLAAFADIVRSDKTNNPEQQTSNQEELRALDRALTALGTKKRAVFVLVELEGLSAEEAARFLEIPPATVRTRLFHARRELQAALRAQGVRP
jgi:RNA polymerase sigma-70 factor, ECF subfamily